MAGSLKLVVVRWALSVSTNLALRYAKTAAILVVVIGASVIVSNWLNGSQTIQTQRDLAGPEWWTVPQEVINRLYPQHTGAPGIYDNLYKRAYKADHLQPQADYEVTGHELGHYKDDMAGLLNALAVAELERRAQEFQRTRIWTPPATEMMGDKTWQEQ